MSDTARPPGVAVAWSSVEARVEANGWEWLALLFEQPPEEAWPLRAAIEACGTAMRHANASVEDGTSEGSGVEPSVHGPVISLHHPGTRESFRAWLTAFARELTRTGCQGRVLASPQADIPDELRPIRARCRPAAFLAYSMTVPPDLRGAPAGTPERWGVDPAVTEPMCHDLAACARVPGGQVILTQGTSRVGTSAQVWPTSWRGRWCTASSPA